MQHLKANTAKVVRIGPAVVVGDGFTTTAALDIETADQAVIVDNDATVVDISGGTWTWAAVTGATGYYDLTLKTTDVDEEGTLEVIIYDVSLCLPIINRFMVLSEAAYDSLYGAKDTGFMDVALADAAHGGSSAVLTLNNAVISSSTGDALQLTSGGGDGNGLQITGDGGGEGMRVVGGATAAGAVFRGGATSGDGIDATAPTLGHGMRTTGAGANKCGLYADTDDTAGWGAGLYAWGDGDQNGATFSGSGTGHGLELEAAGTGKTLEATLTGTDDKALLSSDAQDLSATLDVNAKLLAGAAPNNLAATDILSSGQALDTTLGVLDVVTLVDTATDVTNAVTPDNAADTTNILTDTGTTIPAQLDSMSGATFNTSTDSLEAIRNRGDAAWITGGTGGGSETVTYTVTDSATTLPIGQCKVWVTTDSGGTNEVASAFTDDFGQAVFYLDTGTYYFWRKKSGWNFDNPDTEIVS